MNGFMTFIRAQGVVGLAVGFILGGAVSNLVNAIVNDLIDPILGLLLSSAGSLSELTIPLGNAELLVGHLLYVLVDFVVIAAVVYYGVKGLKLDKIDKKKN